VNPQLEALADDYWPDYLAANPTEAHMLGDYRFVDQFEKVDRASEDSRIASLRGIGERAREMYASALSSADRSTLATLLYQTETRAAVLETRRQEFGLDPIHGPQAEIHFVVPQLTIDTFEHAEAIIDKYIAFASVFDQSIERLREGLASGRLNADFAVNSVLAQVDAWLATPIDDDSLLKATLPEDFTSEQTEEWREEIKVTIADHVRPALGRYRDFIADEIAPRARPDEQAGLFGLPDGDLVYSRLIERYTTFPMQAGEIHQVGLEQVARLADEYRGLGPEALGTSNLDEIFNILRTDKSLIHTSGADIVEVCEVAFERARAEMGNWFGRLPESDCVVNETPHGPIAFYFSPAEDGSRPGTFFMNTADPTAWGHAEVEATAFHEGIPGHHLQIAIAQEMGDALPPFRRNEFISAYGEGWALYSERLSNEMGLYSGPLALIGMLQNDSMRSCRLVVDTGMHALGWSRQQGIDYMLDNSPMSMQQVVGEIDRYLSFPGQALSYMIGRLEIDRMRTDAEAALGNRFDIKQFHDAVLGSGSVPLGELNRIVNEWVAAS
jgi:uncharacterized protein (DUF885 family)